MRRCLPFLLLTLLLVGCGSSLPDGQIVQIDQNGFPRSEVERWQRGLSDLERRPVSLDQALRALVVTQWLQADIVRQGFQINPKRIAKITADLQRKAGKTKARRYALLIEQIAQARAAQELLDNLATEGIEPPNQIQALAAWKAGKGPKEPSTREVSVLITRTREQALRALDRLRQGQNFALAAKGLGQARIIPNLNRKSGRGTAPIFQAPIGELVGPLLQGDRWVVFQVLREQPGIQVPFEQALGSLTDQLYRESRTRALRQSRKRLLVYWRERTLCGPIKDEVCRNGPPLKQLLR